jgi:DNA-binding GntR family transcriptional regulator
MPTFAEIEPLSLSDRVINALKDAFFAGELKPGDAVVERELARQMKVGTPVVREALISLQGQGFVRRVTNTGTFVTQFSVDEIRQIYALRVELELVAMQWARTRVTENDLKELSRQIAKVVEAGERGDRRQFLELDYAFHKRCWALSGNTYLAEILDRLMAPLFAFVVLASGAPLTGSMGREHYELVHALQNTAEPEFTSVVRARLSGFASRWLAAFSNADVPAERAQSKSEGTATGDQ